MLRRDPQTILTAHRMDPERRELYVEGHRDRAFLNWLTSESRHPDSSVVVIDNVEMPEGLPGGNRTRLKHFLSRMESEPFKIRGLVDSDQSRIIPESMPGNAWQTDYRDAEGYVLKPENIDAALRLSYGLEEPRAAEILEWMYPVALRLASLRLASTNLSLDLPISNVRLSKFVHATHGRLALNEPTLIRSLLQAAEISLRRAADVAIATNDAFTRVSILEPNAVCQGKDCMKLLTLQFISLGVSDLKDVSPLLWGTFRREQLSDFLALSEIFAFLTEQSPPP